MDQDMQTSSGEEPVKLANTKGHRDEEEILTNGHLHQQIEEVKKEDDEDSALEKEFIKVEKELIDVKENSLTGKSTTVAEEQSCSPEVKLSSSEPNSELMEAQEKIKQLKLEVGTLAQDLQYAESEKAQFQAEVSIANEKLQQSDKHCEELEIDLRRLKEEMVEAGLKHQSQLESLQEAFGAQEAKHKELLGVKEAFSELSLELECSRKKVENLELDLLSSADGLRKFEELSNERGLHADSESKKALELEKMLEAAKLSAKEMENQMGLMQEELKVLYDKVRQNQHAEEALTRTRSELSVVHEALELSKLLASELEQKVASEEASIQELTQELNLHKASEEQLREDKIAIEGLLSASKEDLQTTDSILKEIELKLQEELTKKETVEANLQIQELQVLSFQEELLRSSKDKETLEINIGELNGNLLQVKERCSDLENKLNLSNQNLIKTDSLLSETLSHNTELQQKLKSLEELQKESGTAADMLSQKNIELEDLLKASSAALEEVKAQLREIEVRSISVEQRNAELEQQLNLAELKCGDNDREINELRDKVSKLSNLLKASEEETEVSRCHFQAYQDRIAELESSLEKSSLRKAELEKELQEVLEKCTEHENRSTAAQEHSLELEELIQVAHSKVENSGNRVGELELLLETSNQRVLELAEQLSITELKHKDIEAELKQKHGQVSELSAELEAFQVKSSSLEIALDAANNKEKELTDLLNVVTEEKKIFEDLSKNSGEKLLEAENLIDVLQIELNSAKENLQNVVKDLEVSGVREGDILEKLKSAEEQLEHQGRAVANATARSLELESLHESLSKESELKLHDAILNFTQKDSEVKELHEKLKSLEEQAASYQDQAAEATDRLSLLKAELEESSNSLVSLESIIDELKTKLLDTEQRFEQSSSENELLAETNMKLKEELEAHQHKFNDLHDSLSSVHAEKDEAAEQLAFHVKTIAELRDEHSKVLELHSETEFQKKAKEAELEESSSRVISLESIIDELKTKLLDTEKRFEQSYSENELLAEANMKLKEELEAHQHKINDLHDSLGSIRAEKDEAAEQLTFHVKTVAELRHEHSKALELHSETEFQKKAKEAELEESSNRLVSLESIIDELKTKLLDTEQRFEQSSSENELLAETNMKLKEELEAHQHNINDLHDSLSSIRAEKDATAEQLAVYEKTIAELTDEHSKALELHSETEFQIKAKEAELEESSNRLASLESIIDELKTKLLDTEKRFDQSSSENELLADTNMKLKEELQSHQHKINDLHDSLSSVHAEKDATAEQLAFHVKTIAELRDEHSKVLELHSDTESQKKEKEAQLNEAFEKLSQRDSEAKGLSDKLNDLESQVKSYEERFCEAAAATEVQTVELDESLSKLRILEGTVEEAKSKSSQLESANEYLAEANMKLTQELAANETKMNDLQATLNAIVTEKESISGELHFLRKTNEDLVQKLASEGEILQSQISSLIEEKNMLHEMYQEARKEIQAVIVQMEEQLNEHRGKEHSLNENVETLMAELKVKSEMQARVAELEHKLLSSEIQFREEIESIRAASAEKEQALTSKVEEYASKLKEKDVLHEQLEQLQRELNLAHATITEQRGANSRKDQEQEAAIMQSLSEVEAKHQHAIVLEKQVEELKQKLHQSEVQSLEKDKEESTRLALVSQELDDLRIKLSQTAELEKKIADLENKLQLAHSISEQNKGEIANTEAKDAVEVKSRDIGAGTTTLRRKSKKRTEGPHSPSAATSASPATTTAEPTGAMALKFILGVALVSMIVGVFLGKQY